MEATTSDAYTVLALTERGQQEAAKWISNLVAHELKMTILAKLLESDFVNASSNLTMPGAVLLKLMRLYLGEHLTLKDLERAAALSPHLETTSYQTAYLVDDVKNSLGVQLRVHRWGPVAASRAPLNKLLREHVERPRPPIAAATFDGQPLTSRPVTFQSPTRATARPMP